MSFWNSTKKSDAHSYLTSKKHKKKTLKNYYIDNKKQLYYKEYEIMNNREFFCSFIFLLVHFLFRMHILLGIVHTDYDFHFIHLFNIDMIINDLQNYVSSRNSFSLGQFIQQHHHHHFRILITLYYNKIYWSLIIKMKWWNGYVRNFR